MNLVSAMLLWLVGSTIIQVVVDNFTGHTVGNVFDTDYCQYYFRFPFADCF